MLLGGVYERMVPTDERLLIYAQGEARNARRDGQEKGVTSPLSRQSQRHMLRLAHSPRGLTCNAVIATLRLKVQPGEPLAGVLAGLC